ncbi:MAG: MFS transporter [Oscillospiraceae bacterium]|nr:MFS transporter [Oscillospiraceae bacterium]
MMHKLNFRHTIIASYFGYITQAILNNLAPLFFLIFMESFDIPLGKVTLIVTINFLVQLFVDMLAGKFVDKTGYRIPVVAAHVFAAAGLVLLAVLPNVMRNSYAGIIIAVCVYAVGGGLTEVLISPIVEACPTDNKAGAMSLLHSFYCWGTVAVILLSTGFMYLFGKQSWTTLCVLWAVVPLVNAVFFCLVPINRLCEGESGMKLTELFKTKVFWVFMVLMFASGASEQAMSQWASAFAESGLKVSKTVGDIAGPCMFSILMGTARVLSSKLSDKKELLNPISLSAALCVGAYLLASLSENAVLSLVGCAVCGFSVGIMWPGVFSSASATLKRGGSLMFAMLALAGDVGCSAGPTVVGFIADANGDSLKTGLLFAIIFPITLIVLSFVCKKIKNKT